MSNTVEERRNVIGGVAVALLLTANSKWSSKIMSQFFAVRLLYIHSAWKNLKSLMTIQALLRSYNLQRQKNALFHYNIQ